jgi:hypothetical protein
LQLRLIDMRPLKSRAAEMRALKLGAGETRALQVRAREIRAFRLRIDEFVHSHSSQVKTKLRSLFDISIGGCSDEARTFNRNREWYVSGGRSRADVAQLSTFRRP